MSTSRAAWFASARGSCDTKACAIKDRATSTNPSAIAAHFRLLSVERERCQKMELFAMQARKRASGPELSHVPAFFKRSCRRSLCGRVSSPSTYHFIRRPWKICAKPEHRATVSSRRFLLTHSERHHAREQSPSYTPIGPLSCLHTWAALSKTRSDTNPSRSARLKMRLSWRGSFKISYRYATGRRLERMLITGPWCVYTSSVSS
jgi:hypothetical protein